MADGVEVRTNLPAFKAELSAFSVKLETNIVRSASNAAAQVFKKAVVAGARKGKTGVLRRAIYVYRRRNPRVGTVGYRVSFRQGRKEQKHKSGSRDAFYGRFLELGWIPRKPGQGLTGGRRLRALKRGRLRASGMKVITQYRFIGPAFVRVKDAALAAFNAKMRERIDKANRER